MAAKNTSGKKRFSLWKILCVLWCVIAVGFWISFFWLVFQEKTYEFLQPRESIAEIHIGSSTGATDLYSYPSDQWQDRITSLFQPHTVLDPSRLDAFLEDFHALECHHWVNDPIPCIQDETIRILYTDGSVEWISACGTCAWDSQTGKADMTWYYFDTDAFREFLRSYSNLP